MNANTKPSVGVLVLGHRGATASTTIGASKLAHRADWEAHLLSARAPGLVEPSEIAWAGWDPFAARETWQKTIERHGVLDLRRWPELATTLRHKVRELDPIALELDHAVANRETSAAIGSGRDLLERLREQIRLFREASGAKTLVLVNLSAPALLPPRERWPQSGGTLLETLAGGELFRSAMPYYVAAAILEGAGVVDYTASATLEIPGLVDLAERQGVPLAGRDGSTGQTLLKSVLAQTFATRRLRVRGWYSANILGNHDGYVLQDGRYCDVKKADKTDLLEPILGYAPESHLVDIRHYGPAGDDKEAWDAIDFECLLGARGRMRVNWQASDSLLAAPAVIDLIRLTAWAKEQGRKGVQSWMGAFFKHPLGTGERRYLELARVLESELARAGSRRDVDR